MVLKKCLRLFGLWSVFSVVAGGCGSDPGASSTPPSDAHTKPSLGGGGGPRPVSPHEAALHNLVPLMVTEEDLLAVVKEALAQRPGQTFSDNDPVKVPPEAWWREPTHFSWLSSVYPPGKSNPWFEASLLTSSPENLNLFALPYRFRQVFLSKPLPAGYVDRADFVDIASKLLANGVQGSTGISIGQLLSFHRDLIQGNLVRSGHPLSSVCQPQLNYEKIGRTGKVYFRWAAGRDWDPGKRWYEGDMYQRAREGKDPFHAFTVNSPESASFAGMGLYLAEKPADSWVYGEIVARGLLEQEFQERRDAATTKRPINTSLLLSAASLDQLALSTVLPPEGLPFYTERKHGKTFMQECLSMVNGQMLSNPGDNIREALAVPPPMLLQFHIVSIPKPWLVLKTARKVLMKPFDGDGLETLEIAKMLWSFKQPDGTEQDGLTAPYFLCDGHSYSDCRLFDFMHRFLARAVSARPWWDEADRGLSRRDFQVRGNLIREEWEKAKKGQLPPASPHLQWTLSGQCGVYADAGFKQLLGLYPLPRDAAERATNPCFQEAILNASLKETDCGWFGAPFFSNVKIKATQCLVVSLPLEGNTFKVLVATEYDRARAVARGPLKLAFDRATAALKSTQARLKKWEADLKKAQQNLKGLPAGKGDGVALQGKLQKARSHRNALQSGFDDAEQRYQERKKIRNTQQDQSKEAWRALKKQEQIVNDAKERENSLQAAYDQAKKAYQDAKNRHSRNLAEYQKKETTAQSALTDQKHEVTRYEQQAKTLRLAFDKADRAYQLAQQAFEKARDERDDSRDAYEAAQQRVERNKAKLAAFDADQDQRDLAKQQVQDLEKKVKDAEQQVAIDLAELQRAQDALTAANKGNPTVGGATLPPGADAAAVDAAASATAPL